mgnify:CR=1 FL=1
MQTYTFTRSELLQLLFDTIALFARQEGVSDFSANAPRLTVDEVLALLAPPIPFDGSLPTDDSGNAEFDAAIEPVF